MKISLKLNYVLPNGTAIQCNYNDVETEWWDNWLDWMIRDNPETIFFYTVDSTDIFEKEWDFNEYAYMVPLFELEDTVEKHQDKYPTHTCGTSSDGSMHCMNCEWKVTPLEPETLMERALDAFKGYASEAVPTTHPLMALEDDRSKKRDE